MNSELTLEKLLKMKNSLRLVVHYAENPFLERNISYIVNRGKPNEFVMFHPDDFEMLKNSDPTISFIHIRDWQR